MARNYISNKDETVRLFQNGFLESLSRVHPVVPVLVFAPVNAFCFYIGIAGGLTLTNFLLAVVGGVFTWTVTEYVLHRFVFHYQPSSAIGKRMHFLFHGVHHDYPNDSRRLVMPPSVSVPLALLFFFIFTGVVPKPEVYPFFAAFMTGYLFYDITHYAVHHFNLKNPLLLALKKHHLKHHYQNSSLGYGVSSPLWDVVAGTNFSTKEEA